MTLEEYFHLSRPAFPRAAHKDCLLLTPGLEQVIDRLLLAISRDTIALLIAESGCAKSTALSLLGHRLDAASYFIISTSLTTLAPFSFLALLAQSSGLQKPPLQGRDRRRPAPPPAHSAETHRHPRRRGPPAA